MRKDEIKCRRLYRHLGAQLSDDLVQLADCERENGMSIHLEIGNRHCRNRLMHGIVTQRLTTPRFAVDHPRPAPISSQHRRRKGLPVRYIINGQHDRTRTIAEQHRVRTV